MARCIDAFAHAWRTMGTVVAVAVKDHDAAGRWIPGNTGRPPLGKGLTETLRSYMDLPRRILLSIAEDDDRPMREVIAAVQVLESKRSSTDRAYTFDRLDGKPVQTQMNISVDASWADLGFAAADAAPQLPGSLPLAIIDAAPLPSPAPPRRKRASQ